MTVQLPQENLSWYSVLNIFHKVTSAITCWLHGDFGCQNMLILNQDCWSYLKMYHESGFWDTLYITNIENQNWSKIDVIISTQTSQQSNSKNHDYDNYNHGKWHDECWMHNVSYQQWWTQVHCVSKKQDTWFFIITLANMNRFSKFFHCHIPKKIL